MATIEQSDPDRPENSADSVDKVHAVHLSDEFDAFGLVDSAQLVDPSDTGDTVLPVNLGHPTGPVESVHLTQPADSGNIVDPVHGIDLAHAAGLVGAGDSIEAALNHAKLGPESSQAVVTLLKEISESLRDLRNHSARFMNVADLAEAEEHYKRRQDGKNSFQNPSQDRRARQDRERRRNSRVRGRGSRSIKSKSYYSSSDSESGPERFVREAVRKTVEENVVEKTEDVSPKASTTSPRERARFRNSDNRMTRIGRGIPADQRDDSSSRRHPQDVSDDVESRSNSDRRRSRDFNEVVVIEDYNARGGSSSAPRSRRGENVRTNVRRLRGYEISSEDSGSSHSDSESADAENEEHSETNSQLTARSMNSNESERRLLKGYITKSVKYGYFPHPHLCEQLFGGMRGLSKGHKSKYYPWLREKGVIFARDERCSFTFDIANLTNYSSISRVRADIKRVERFAHNLRMKGGFFFFRESYLSDKIYRNKIYNGTHVIRCKDNRRHALPRLSSEPGGTFCQKFPEVLPRGEMPHLHVSEAVQQMIDEARLNTLREDVIGASSRRDVISEIISLNSNSRPLEPPVTYHYNGKPKLDFNKGPPTGAVTSGGSRPDIIHREAREVYQDPHVTAPWRRLCVLTGLSRVSYVDKSPMGLEVPLFAQESKIDRGNDDVSIGSRSSKNEDDEDDKNDDDNDCDNFYDESISEHLSYEQLAIRQTSRRRVVKFQFSWYEMIPHGESENRKYCGKLYQDKEKRSIQLQSFMVIGVWQKIDEDRSGDSKFWTLVIMAPAFFYHNNADDFDNKNASKELNDLIGPLKNILPTISATLLMIIPKIVAHWTKISDYVEQFIAGQDSFLHEKKHDRLLFDDDSFTRSRQYFWAITSTGEFILIIDKTINHSKNIAKWVSKDRNERTKHDEMRMKLEAVRDRFERQRERASELREGLFSASSVVESRLSTRLGQNVKLLTYVSIFYLPLAFCAAIWAIPNITERTTRTAFIVAAFLVGLVTYFIVFNLDALVTVCWEAYSGFRRGAIRQMTKDSKNSSRGNTWQKRAKGFNRFEPDRGATRPSEWHIIWYTLLYLFGRSISVEKSMEEDENDGESSCSASDADTSSSDMASESSAESSRRKSYISWVRDRFRRVETASTPASVEGSSLRRSRVSTSGENFRNPRTASTPANNEESSQDKAWVSWLRKLFRKDKNEGEKRGPGTV